MSDKKELTIENLKEIIGGMQPDLVNNVDLMAILKLEKTSQLLAMFEEKKIALTEDRILALADALGLVNDERR